MIVSHGPIRIAIVPVEAVGRASRRAAERHAVAQCFDLLRASDPDVPPFQSLGHDRHGAPLLTGWQLSITHSRAVAAVAVCPSGLSPAFGIDAEEWRAALLKVTSKYLSPLERASNPGPDALLRLWTIKEAVYKASSADALTLTAIETNPEQTLATAAGQSYSLISVPHPLSTITLALAEP